MTEVVGKDVFFKSLLIEGSNGLQAELKGVTTDARLRRTADGVTNIELTVFDAAFNLLRSNIMNARITIQFEGVGYELVQVKKSGEKLTIVFEDMLVAEMRRHTEPRKFAPGTVTRVEAARTLLGEIPWARMAVGANRQEKVKVELARGQLSAVPKDKDSSTTVEGPLVDYFSSDEASPSAPTPKVKKRETTITEEDREDTWTAIKRWFAEINWRCYVDQNVLNVGPDSAYIAGDPVYKITDGMKGLASYVDFDWDVGKPTATANYSVFIERFAQPPGTCIELTGMGPASGKWLVLDNDRDLFNYVTDIKLQYPEPELPEPDPPALDDAGQDLMGPDASYFGSAAGASFGVGGASGGSSTWKWPATGPITSGFGRRGSPGSGGSTNHKGIDIGAPAGRPVVASRSGVVTFAGPLGGYGNLVVITHAKKRADGGQAVYCESRYAHLSTISVRRGLPLLQGTKIGTVGSTGNSTGPHLHFEICRGTGSGSQQIDPLPILNGTVDF